MDNDTIRFLAEATGAGGVSVRLLAREGIFSSRFVPKQ
jgi:hypothetical protein